MQTELGGHSYSASREIKGLSDLLDKTGSVKFVAAEAAQNRLTDTQEFSWGDVFMKFSYQSKGGKLFANGRPIENISDANEIGGDRMDRVLNALDKMILDKNITESIVVSEDLGYGRHFIYRYKKEKNGDIDGLAFEYQGTNEELGEVVRQLGSHAVNRPDREVNFSNPLFFTDGNKNSVKDLSDAARSSFKTKERREEMESYLKRLDRDSKEFDQLMERRQKQEAELAKQFEKIILSNEDAKTGIAVSVYGSIDMMRRMEGEENRRREEIRLPYISVTNDHNIRRVLPNYEPEMPPAANQFQENQMKDEADTQVAEKGEENKKKEQAKMVIEQVVPALIGISAVILAIEDVNYEMKTDGFKHNEINKTRTENEDEIFWREFITEIFGNPLSAKPIEQMTFSPQKEETEKPEEMPVLISEVQPDYSTLDYSIFPILYEDKATYESQLTNFQAGLDIVIGLFQKQSPQEFVQDENIEEKLKKNVVEKEIVKLGKEMVKSIFSREGEKLQGDPFVMLLFLIKAYEEPNCNDKIKQLLASFIHKQIQEIIENRIILSRYPQIKAVVQKFKELSPYTDFLRVKLERVIKLVTSFYSERFFDKDSKRILGITSLTYLMMAIYYLQFSVEKLQSFANLNAKKRAVKNGKRRFQKNGVIFLFDKTVIYQYLDLQHLSA